MTTRSTSRASQHDRSDCAAWQPSTYPGDAKPPFDGADLRRVPRPREDDPPYRPWWVIDAG